MNYKVRTVNLNQPEPKISDMEYSDFRVPIPEIQEQHWKVGDCMSASDNDSEFIIGNIAVVSVDAKKNIFEIRYYDKNGDECGHQTVKLITMQED